MIWLTSTVTKLQDVGSNRIYHWPQILSNGPGFLGFGQCIKSIKAPEGGLHSPPTYSFPLYDYDPCISRMVNISTTTPQLKAAKAVVEAYGSRDLKNTSIFAKNFKFQSFPKTTDHYEETKAEHFQNYGGVLASYAKMDVSIQLRVPCFKLPG
jgi:hypothetical protein